MLKLVGFVINIFLIGIIFLRIPQESAGLSSFATKNNIWGSSPSSIERGLNIATVIGILIYFYIAINLNLSNL